MEMGCFTYREQIAFSYDFFPSCFYTTPHLKLRFKTKEFRGLFIKNAKCLAKPLAIDQAPLNERVQFHGKVQLSLDYSLIVLCVDKKSVPRHQNMIQRMLPIE